ncbi:MAG: hypothetical protein HYZ87_01830 [Candidatus Omnitrophica bacterium]|nr:hypothetical protein [Candidatus Omnitrophota bacterium]
MSFELLNRQPQVKEYLGSALKKSRLPHALLFAGPARSGQREAALVLAKSLFCEKGILEGGCDVCVQCRQVSGAAHPDLFILEVQKDSKVIKIEAVRELIARAGLRPFQARAKLFVIDGAERLNEDAQNALLKTLEEPEGSTFFVLITSSPERLLSTIRSRVHPLRFLPIETGAEKSPEIDLLKRRLLSLALGDSASASFGVGMEETDWSRLDREILIKVFEDLISYLRDLLLIRVGVPDLVAVGHEKLEKEKTAARLEEGALRDKIERLAEFKEKLKENANLRLLMAALTDELEHT